MIPSVTYGSVTGQLADVDPQNASQFGIFLFSSTLILLVLVNYRWAIFPAEFSYSFCGNYKYKNSKDVCHRQSLLFRYINQFSTPAKNFTL